MDNKNNFRNKQLKKDDLHKKLKKKPSSNKNVIRNSNL